MILFRRTNRKGRRVTLAWYRRRGLRTEVGYVPVRGGRGHWFVAAFGPLYFGSGTGVPIP